MYFVLGIAEGRYPAWREKASYTVPREFVRQDYGTAVSHICVPSVDEKFFASQWLACVGAFTPSMFASVWAPPECGDSMFMARADCKLRGSGKVELDSMRLLQRVRPRLDGDRACDGDAAM